MEIFYSWFKDKLGFLARHASQESFVLTYSKNILKYALYLPDPHISVNPVFQHEIIVTGTNQRRCFYDWGGRR